MSTAMQNGGRYQGEMTKFHKRLLRAFVAFVVRFTWVTSGVVLGWLICLKSSAAKTWDTNGPINPVISITISVEWSLIVVLALMLLYLRCSKYPRRGSVRDKKEFQIWA